MSRITNQSLISIIILVLIIELRAILQLFFASLMIIIDRRLSLGLVLLWTILVLFDLLAICVLLYRLFRILKRQEKIKWNCLMPSLSKDRNKGVLIPTAIIHLVLNIFALVLIISGSRSGLFFDTLGVVNSQTNSFIIFLVSIWIISVVIICCIQVLFIWKCAQSKD